MTAKKTIVLLLFNTIRLLALVARAHVTGYRFALCAGFGAFQNDVLSWHNLSKVEVTGKPRKTQCIGLERKLFLFSSSYGLR
jgi:hypothetical protein